MSSELDIKDPKVFRDLSKPVGAQSDAKLEKCKARQEEAKYLEDPEYLFANHYSSPGTVLYFLVRKVPELMIRRQNGVWSTGSKHFKSIL